jgi:hypothetical protein
MLVAVAVIVLVPAVRPVAMPVASMVATAAFDDFHVAVALKSLVEPSE